MGLSPKQTTVRKPVEIKGVGLFSGRRVAVRLLPAPADSGVTFVRTDLPGIPRVPARTDRLGFIERRTTLHSDGVEIHTIEHVLACCTGLGIDNLVVEMSAAELPVGDGSALTFAKPLREVGLVELDRPRRHFRVDSAITVEDGPARLDVLPGTGSDLSIHYTLEYPDTSGPLGRQQVAFRVTPEVFLEQIAPARTFCLEAEAAEMKAKGVGAGATYENTLIIGPRGPIGNAYRFPDEPARHKVLDLLGDLALLGRSLRGEIRCVRSGHSLNARLVEVLSRKIARRICQVRHASRITTTRVLANAVESAYGAAGKRPGRIHPATRVFQALRIAVNHELDNLQTFLGQVPAHLKPGGRLAIISFHSLEDGMVKRWLRGAREDMEEITRRPVVADPAERQANPRSRSAKLRVARRTEA